MDKLIKTFLSANVVKKSFFAMISRIKILRRAFWGMLISFLILILPMATNLTFAIVKPSDTPREIPVVITFDNNYIYPASVAVFSMLQNAKPNTFYKLYAFVPNDFSETNKSKLLSLHELFKNFNLEFVDMGECYKNAFVSGHIKNPAYYKFNIPDILPQFDKCLYCDVDTLILNDLGEMYDFDLHGKGLGGVADRPRYEIKSSRAKYFPDTFVSRTDKYINSGILLYDLAVLREQNLVQKLTEYLASHPSPIYHDQSAINEICYDQITDIPVKYNIMTFYNFGPSFKSSKTNTHGYSPEEWEEAMENPTIIHYAGLKPWNDPDVPFSEKWCETAKQTPFWEEIKAKYFNKIKGDYSWKAIIAGQELSSEKFGDTSHWIQIASSGENSLILRAEALTDKEAIAFGFDGNYEYSALQNVIKAWYYRPGYFQPLKNNAVYSDAASTLGTYGKTKDSKGFSKPILTGKKGVSKSPFLLSFQEAASFASTCYECIDEKCCRDSSTNANRNLQILSDWNEFSWYLRSSKNEDSSGIVNEDGRILQSSNPENCRIRPALWVKTEFLSN
jgi:lipopolysaccharide biosynthesis glycosyltransferase